MKQKVICTLALLCTVAQGLWAQALVKSEQELLDAIDYYGRITLDADIKLEKSLLIRATLWTTIDLNGHKLYRSLNEYDLNNHVITIENGGALTLKSSVEGGSIQGGRATFGGGIMVYANCSLTVDGVKFTDNSASDHGGAIFAQGGSTLTLSNVTFISNSAGDHAGAIWNNGTLTATDCTFTDNTASDVGGIYNSVTVDGVGKATLTSCTFTENEGTAGAGALANALGATEMTIEDCTITDNIASGHGGAIWNGGTLTVTNSTFTNNIANDVGGIYNATDGTTAGNATLRGCTFTRNRGIAGAGALANAWGATKMTIEDCIIENNSAYQYGAGIWNGGTLNVKGEVKVTGNKNNDNAVSNLYLKNGKFFTVTGNITGSNIGVDLESISGRFTSGYNTHHNGVDPSTFFSTDRLSAVSLGLDDKGEVCLFGHLPISYIERSWDETNKKVANTEKGITSLIAYHIIPTIDGQYKEVTNAPASTPDEWFGMGGYSDNFPEFYVVREDVNRENIVVQGSNVHLILCDGVTLTLTGGLILEDDHKLYIHCQSYGDKMGKLIVTNKNAGCAGIGSSSDEYKCNVAGELVIHGGHIEATGSEESAGIGSGSESKGGTGRRCKSVTVYGGYVKATGSKRSAGIGGGGYFPGTPGINGGDFYLYGGTVLAIGGSEGAGIGGGSWGDGGQVYVYGGSLTAIGGEEGPGIGAGSRNDKTPNSDEVCGGMIRIYGGTVTANGGKYAAGIGGGKNAGGALFYINGGTVTANGGEYAAGIGGGDGGVGGNVFIDGGMVTANGGKYAAGIGGGESKFGGTVIIGDGTVTANGGISAAGIGGGYAGAGGDVKIIGGTVTAKAGTQGGEEGRAIGQGKKREKTLSNGTLTFDDATMMVGAGNDGSVERIYNADERVNACWYRTYAEISPCTHPSGVTYTINEDGTHTTHCKHCSLAEKADHFNSDGTGTCICGYKDGGVYYTITIATSRSDTGYEGVGVMTKVGNNMPYTLPVCSTFPDGYDFAGWAVNPINHNGIRPNEGEELKQAGENITVTGDVSIFARYRVLTISLADDSDNAETLYNYNGKNNAGVTLTDRTLYKDGGWNTLCLPFDLTIAGSPLDGDGVDVRTLASSSFDELNGTLTLTFTPAEGEGAVTAIEAGKPYIIKWTSGSDIDEPTFSGVTISNETSPVETKYVDFVGTYSPIDIFTEYKTNLYLGANDKLFYPAGEDSFIINSCRAFFQLKEGLTAGEPVSTDVQEIRSFVLNFGEETGIEEVNGYGLGVNGYGAGWCTLDGRRLGSKPTDAGLYIHNGRKVLIK